MLSNCYLWARSRYRELESAWIKAGRPAGQEPYILRRPSRSEPRSVPHFLVGRRDHTGVMELESFKPDEPKNVPWYMAWSRLLFRGSVHRGDAP